MTDALLTFAADTAAIWLVAFAASAAVFLTTAFTLEAINRRHPERKIQTREPGSERLGDALSSFGQLAVTCLCIALGLALQRAGVGVAPFEATWWSVPLMAVVGIILLDAWFYWAHRLLHTRALYRFHKPHHRHVTPTVWSNDSTHWLDTAITHGFYVLLPVLTPVPLASVVVLRLFDQVTAIIGHSGYEHFAGATARWPWLGICTLFHDQHHSAFRYNYGNFFSLWDRLFGTIHPRYDDEVKGWEARYGDADAARRHPAE